MKIYPANLQLDRSHESVLPHIPHCAIALLEKSGIGEAFLNQDHSGGILILEQADLPSLQDVLDEEPWFGTKDQMPMVKYFADLLAQKPEQKNFYFMVMDS